MNQDFEKERFEIIVVKNFNDPSIDNFIMNNHIKSFFSEETSYPKRILNSLSITESNIVCFLEDDDLYLPNHLRFVYNTFSKNPKIGFIKGGFIKFSNAGVVVDHTWKKVKKSICIESDKLTLKKVISIHSYGGSAIISASAIRKDLLISALERFPSVNLFDYIIPYFVLYRTFNVLISSEIITRYRVSNSWTHVITKNMQEFQSRKIFLLEKTISDYQMMEMTFRECDIILKAIRYQATEMTLELSVISGKSKNISGIMNYIICSFLDLNLKRLALLGLYLISRICRNCSSWFLYKIMEY